MADRFLSVVAQTRPENMTFGWLRSMFKGDNGLKDTLDRGRAVLDTPEKLDQYLYTHGLMIESQWEHVTPYLADHDPPVLWIDYGCGQGLAGLLIKDNSSDDLFRAVSDIVLIEPSALALARAEAVYRKLAPAAKITCLCKRFEHVQENDIPAAPAGPVLHLFSNSMDIEGVDSVGLISKALRPGPHRILAVSNDRYSFGGTPQIVQTKAAFENPTLASWLTIHESELVTFTCNNQSESKAVVWFCDLEVKDG